jgi:flagellar hook-associated protein 2
LPASPGAAIGGHEIEVLQLADSAQRTFTFTSPAAEETITVNGREIKLKAAETAAELASKLNSGGEGSGVYATVLANGSLVLSSRSTGAAGAVAVTGGALAEVAGTAKEGKNAEFVLDGVHETSESNVLTEAIPGVTMTLQALTTVGSPVSIDVQPPTTSPAALESQVQSFIKLYNSTISAIQKQITTRPPQKPSSATEFATGTLFGDGELTSVLDTMRQAMYEPLAGLPSGVNSLADIGVSTGAATGGGESSQASLEGQLTLDPAKLAEAVKNDPEAVEKMLGEWSKNFQSLVGGVAEPGGTLEGRANGDGAQVAELTNQITSMTESLNQREHALIETYAELEAVISQNSAQSSWLAQQSGSSSGG